MIVKNPHHVLPIEAQVNALKGRVNAYMQANSGKSEFTLEEIKAALPDDAEQLTEGLFQEVCQRLSIEVIR